MTIPITIATTTMIEAFQTLVRAYNDCKRHRRLGCDGAAAVPAASRHVEDGLTKENKQLTCALIHYI